jgi:hypothetical protein
MKRRPRGAQRSTVADAQESCSYDAPSNGNADPLPPRQCGYPPERHDPNTWVVWAAPLWAARGQSPDVPEMTVSGALVAPAVATG